MKLQSSMISVPSEFIDPPLPVALPLMNVIPLNVTVASLAISNILDLWSASMITLPLPSKVMVLPDMLTPLLVNPSLYV